jgi:hypothetical protein
LPPALAVLSLIDTVERFQGGERTVTLVSAAESDWAHLLASCEFRFDPRRLSVALSRAKRLMILVARLKRLGRRRGAGHHGKPKGTPRGHCEFRQESTVSPVAVIGQVASTRLLLAPLLWFRGTS